MTKNLEWDLSWNSSSVKSILQKSFGLVADGETVPGVPGPRHPNTPHEVRYDVPSPSCKTGWYKITHLFFLRTTISNQLFFYFWWDETQFSTHPSPNQILADVHGFGDCLTHLQSLESKGTVSPRKCRVCFIQEISNKVLLRDYEIIYACIFTHHHHIPNNINKPYSNLRLFYWGFWKSPAHPFSIIIIPYSNLRFFPAWSSHLVSSWP